ncbi:hypothetical protein CHELA20_51096 [Hyphomicrobiales bacterium]|nr:hypothetical protein CHELA20_51096 [Hyphomicrobiales bacterium]CAH1674086.1 hypothetical protein CHELA41_23916 [Hyphomicrobiales bacterium]
MAGPIEQFKITPIIPIEMGGLDLSATESSAYMLLVVFLLAAFFFWRPPKANGFQAISDAQPSSYLSSSPTRSGPTPEKTACGYSHSSSACSCSSSSPISWGCFPIRSP